MRTPALIQPLEPRALLSAAASAAAADNGGYASYVNAHVRDGLLVIRGGPNGDGIVIEREGLTGSKVSVRGDSFTAVNARGDGVPTVFDGVTRGVLVSLRGGDDSLVVRDGAFPGRLTVATGKGDDDVLIASAVIGRGGLVVRTHAGADRITVVGAGVDGGATVVSGGSGRDAVSVVDSAFDGDVLIHGRGGRDAVTVAANAFNAGARVRGGGSADAFGDAGGVVTRRFDFGDGGTKGWQAGFADYDSKANLFDGDGNPLLPNAEAYYELGAGIRPLPTDLGADPGQTGFHLAGINRSDDLFMYLRRRLGTADGVVPGQAYLACFAIDMASDASPFAGGAGGLPAASVVLKAGAGPDEPARAVDDNDHWRMTVDIGSQSVGGTAASVAGDIGNGLPYSDPPKYKGFKRRHVHRTPAVAAANGDLWLLVGTDSGFEGPTNVFYRQIRVTLIPVAR